MTRQRPTWTAWSTVRLVGVVVPARDEAAELPGCLASLAAAAGEVARWHPVADVSTVVVLDGCTDTSADVARDAGVTVRELPVPGGVGVARREGCELVLREAARRGVPPGQVWLATTDADCRVPLDWLSEQLRHRAAGAGAVVGTVDVPESADRAGVVLRRWRMAYQPVDGHPHVHGANLGIDGAAYLAVGGFAALQLHEDVAMVAALERRVTVARPGMPRVLTSGRRDVRARNGFGDTLTRDYEDGYPATG